MAAIPNTVSILGIASDEPERIERHQAKENVLLPLVEVGWTEADCRKWCEENDLLSPIYTTATRGGVGSVTIKGLDNCDYFAEIIPNYGSCCSSGIATVLYRLSRMDIRCTTLTGDSLLRTKVS